MRRFPVLLIGFTIISLVFCGQSPVDRGSENISTFPLTPGSRWEYVQNYYEISADDITQADTFASQVIRRVIGVDSSFEIAGLTMVDDSVTSMDDTIHVFTNVTRRWLKIEDDKLLEYGYQFLSPGWHDPPNYWPYPRTLLQYPLTGDKSWVMGESELGSFNCVVLGNENYQFGERTFYCGLVKTLFPYSPNTYRIEWYANSGLIYGHIYYGLQYRDDELGNIVDSVYAHQDTYLENIHIVQ